MEYSNEVSKLKMATMKNFNNWSILWLEQEFNISWWATHFHVSLWYVSTPSTSACESVKACFWPGLFLLLTAQARTGNG